MAIPVADNFSYKGEKPLDARIKYATISDMVNVPASDLYDGCLAYVVSEKTNYQYDSSNTSDPDTGKWRELETGGGGTTYTAGDGINIDANNEISVKEMAQEDMSEIVNPLPGTMSRRMKHSTEEQIIGEWIDGKPIYQKTIETTTSSDDYAKYVSIGASVDKVIYIHGFCLQQGGYILPNCFWATTISNSAVRGFKVMVNNNSAPDNPNCLGIAVPGLSDARNQPAWITIQYTKTTD